MNETKDELDLLREAARKVRAPRLSEELLHAATKDNRSATMREKMRLAAPAQRLSFASVAATLVACLAIAPALLSENNSKEFHLSLGSDQHSAGTSMGLLANSAVGALADGSVSMTDGSYTSMNQQAWLDNSYFLPSTRISDQRGSGTVYRVDDIGNTETLARALATYFGLNKNLITNEIGDASASLVKYHVSNLNGNDKSLSTYDFQGLQFSYFDPNAYIHGPCLHTAEAKVPVDLDGNPTKESDPNNTSKSYCTVYGEIEPRFPTNAEAQRQVVELADAVGIKLDPKQVVIQRYKDYFYATVTLKAGTDSTSYQWFVNWQNSGKIGSAGGHVIRFVPVKNLVTVSALDAVGRLTDGRWHAQMAGEHYRFPSAHWNDKFEVVKPDAPIDPTRRNRYVVELAEQVATTVVDSSGQPWIVPGYAMYLDSGIYAVVGLEDGVIDLPEVSTLVPSDSGYIVVD